MEPIKYGARVKYWAWLALAMFMLFVSKYSYATTFADLKFGKNQFSDTQWNVSACTQTNTCQIYSLSGIGTSWNTGSPYTLSSTQYIQFSQSNDANYPWTMKVYNSDGSVAANLGNGKLSVQGEAVDSSGKHFFFFMNANYNGTVFSTDYGFPNSTGFSFTGTLNPTVAQTDTFASTGSTTPLAAGQTYTPPAPTPTTTCNPCSPQGTNLGFESGTTANWTISNGTGTEKTSGWSDNGDGVTTSKSMVNYQPGGGKTWTVTPYGTWMMVIQAGGASPTFDQASASLGLTPTQVQELKTFLQNQGGNSNPTNASWAKRTVTLEAGKVYVVAWQYLSTDYVPFNDGSMMTLTGPSLPKLNNENKNYALLGFTNPGTGNYSTDSYGATGWQLATIEVTVTGDYELGFASFNLGDTALSPILFVDDLQGTTTLNGTAFAPVPPNPGSSAPTTGGGSSAPACPNGSTCSQTAFSANTGFNNRATVWSQQNGSKVIIEQIGNNSTFIAVQIGKKNYIEIKSTGSNNDFDVRQTTGSSPTGSNYAEITVNGSNNSVGTLQNSTGGGVKGILLNMSGAGNTVAVGQQYGVGNHYAEITLTGGNKNVSVSQEGNGGHMAKIELSGGATSMNLTQQGSTQQFYSITHNCAQISCAAITVTQGQQ